jgi:P-type Ca2+ transporter type 2C
MISPSALQLVQTLESDVREGLSSGSASERLKRDGRNVLQSAPPMPWWVRFIAQFESMMVGLLVGAAILSGFLGDWVDTWAILAIVLLNAAIGFFQEERAHQAILALRSLSAPQAKVTRDGRWVTIPAHDVVVGDILHLEAGDRVPADARLLEAFQLQTLEASLTGESTPVDKDAMAEWEPDAPVADRSNAVFLGTAVTAGKALAVVTGTGMKTEIGRIARLLEQVPTEETPLQKRLSQLGQILVMICLVMVSIIFAIQWLRGGKLSEVFLTSISLAVAAVPEGLPAVVTVTLAIGLRRMAKRNALIRKLPSVETLGCVTVICSDKTGTLTRNEMTVKRLWIHDSEWYVDGEGYAPEGEISPNEHRDAEPTALPDTLLQMLRCADRCNDSQWRFDREHGTIESVGDPTEIALKVVAAKGGIDQQAAALEPVMHENPFDSERKRMSRVIRDRDHRLILLVKGAPESVLSASDRIQIDGDVHQLEDSHRQRIGLRNAEMASQAMRVLAFAYREVEEDHAAWHREEQLIFLGLIGMIDPPRHAVVESVARCRQAGIRPVMITGDHPQTALAIAKEVGIAEEHGSVLLGASIEDMDATELAARVQECSVVARVSPQDKLRVVQAWKRNGHVVAMTGDGVNDAPALKAADIGIAMGITGTDVAKEASDMILTDDNFVSIVNAVEEGRGIYENIQKTLHFLLACNTSEVLFMFVASLIGWPSPLLAIQILWINLITDGLPAIALASEPLGGGPLSLPKF